VVLYSSLAVGSTVGTLISASVFLHRIKFKKKKFLYDKQRTMIGDGDPDIIQKPVSKYTYFDDFLRNSSYSKFQLGRHNLERANVNLTGELNSWGEYESTIRINQIFAKNKVKRELWKYRNPNPLDVEPTKTIHEKVDDLKAAFRLWQKRIVIRREDDDYDIVDDVRPLQDDHWFPDPGLEEYYPNLEVSLTDLTFLRQQRDAKVEQKTENEKLQGKLSRTFPFKSVMDVEEAESILDLELGTYQLKDIRRSQVLLMKEVHPDRGGSSFLATKINQAKDLLEREEKKKMKEKSGKSEEDVEQTPNKEEQ